MRSPGRRQSGWERSAGLFAALTGHRMSRSSRSCSRRRAPASCRRIFRRRRFFSVTSDRASSATASAVLACSLSVRIAAGDRLACAPRGFAFDSTVTLCRRLARREKWYVTHRESAYQRAALRFGKHAPVTAIVIAVDVVLALLCWIGLTRPGMWGAVVSRLRSRFSCSFTGRRRSTRHGARLT